MRLVRGFFLPGLLYLVCFIVLTFPLIQHFSTHFFSDSGDGGQNIWNLWWVNQAVSVLHQSPWVTPYLHFPEGTTLIGHTLNPFNGFMAVFLLKFFSLVQVHNLIILFSFVFGGITAFWLVREVTGSYAEALLGGFIFTFCNYHFAHGQGHMQLIALEWLPLFVLTWIKWIEKPTFRLAIAAAAVLFLVLLCDYYYFLYSVMFGALWWVQSDWKRRDRILPGVVFTLFVLLTSGILVFKLLHAAKVDPFQGAHDPSENSLDLFSILIPGGHWKFSRLTEFFWGQLPGNINESSVHLGFAGCIMLGVAWAWRKKVQQFSPNRWFVVLGFFFIMSLGPKLEIFGHQIPWFYLPYRLLEIMLPPLRLSGCPQRMVVMVNLCAAILIPAALQMMSQSRVKVKSFASVLLVLLFFEFLPAAMPETDSRMPEFVEFLKSEPRGYAMIDVDANVPEGRALLYQTRHQIPMFGGYISRYPLSVVLKDNEIRRQIELGQFKGLCEDLGFRYLLFKGDGRSRVIAGRTFSAVYSGEGYEIYDLVEGWTCINHVRKV